MNHLCNKFIEYMIHKQLIDQSKKEIYVYGMKLTLYKIIYAIIILSMCFLLKRSLFDLLLFYFSYMSIRKYSGGYHAPNIQFCMIVFAITYYLLEYFIVLCQHINCIYILIFSLILILFIYFRSPIDCENKRLNHQEKVVYKKYTLYVSIFWLCIMMILCVFNFSRYSILLYTYLSIALFLLI